MSLQRINRLYGFIHLILIVTISVIILITKFVSGAENLLYNLTKENGLFEWFSFLVAIFFSVFAVIIYFRSLKRKIFTKSQKVIIVSLAITTFLISMEEISWGQHLFGFQSSEFFIENNNQNETNLHNLISGEILNLVIYAIIYIFFVFIPLIFYLIPDIINDRWASLRDMKLGQILFFQGKYPTLKSHSWVKNQIRIYLPSPQNILMFCFASSLQAYFLPRTYTDTIVLWLSLIFIFIVLLKKKELQSKMLWIHYLFVILACLIFALCYKVFKYNNMQYEIREFVIGYALLYWFYNWALARFELNSKNKITL